MWSLGHGVSSLFSVSTLSKALVVVSKEKPYFDSHSNQGIMECPKKPSLNVYAVDMNLWVHTPPRYRKNDPAQNVAAIVCDA